MSENNTEMSDSFGVRVCDDLSEELLQYLTIEDKLRLECVSKQFQRTVFTKHNHIVIDKKLKGIVKNFDTFFLEVNCERLAIVLKKCQNIIDITIDGKD